MLSGDANAPLQEIPENVFAQASVALMEFVPFVALFAALATLQNFAVTQPLQSILTKLEEVPRLPGNVERFNKETDIMSKLRM
jgi:hypothetical protein